MDKIYQESLLFGDALNTLKTLSNDSIQCCITSPPYFGLRDYGHAGQIGLEETPEEYVTKLVSVFREVRRVLKDDGTFWLNLGDSYASTKVGNTNGTAGRVKQKKGVNDDTRKRTIPNGLKHKDLIGIPWRVALALQADGWYLRQDIIWAKPNPMPESVTDRCTKSHEYLFLLSKSKQYYFDHEAIKETAIHAGRVVKATGDKSKNASHVSMNETKIGFTKEDKLVGDTRNKRSVWTITTKPYKGAHFATFPEDLVEPCILAGSKPGDTILDPFMGSGTTLAVAKRLNRGYVGIELNADYESLIRERLLKAQRPML